MSKTVLILGGRGFLGRHIAEHLHALGANIVIGTRSSKLQCNKFEYRTVRINKLAKHGFDSCVFSGIDIVINSVGILRERLGESYDEVHHIAVKKLAQKCATLNIPLIHISALGLQSPVKSQFLISKRNGEQALKASAADWTIVRPSLLDGEGGFGAKWFRRVAKWPIHFLPKSSIGKLAPIHVQDFGEAVAKLALFHLDEFKHQSLELGGGNIFELGEYLNHLNSNQSHKTVRIPSFIARTVAHLCDLLHFTPFSFGHYELLKFDNIPDNNLTHYFFDKPLTPLGRKQQRLPELIFDENHFH